jgi:hypothetical protein
MSKFIEASLVLIFSIAFTTLIMVVVLPVHALGGGGSAAKSEGFQSAVYVEGIRSCPASGATEGSCPFLARQLAGAACPYIAATAAASGCPAFSPRDSTTTCPYTGKEKLPDPRMKLASIDPAPTAQDS